MHGIDKHLQRTQCGFRPNKSTSDPIHIVRRIMSMGERADMPINLVLLDWEKALDKVTHQGRFNAMERMNIDNKLISLVNMMSKDISYMVEIDGQKSSWKQQQSGMRQGCPLSPCMFLLIMHTIFYEVHQSKNVAQALGGKPSPRRRLRRNSICRRHYYLQ